MEAKYKILSYEEYDKVRGVGAPCAYGLMEPYLRKQAEISPKAGEEKGRFNGLLDGVAYALPIGKQQGIKEVVEFANQSPTLKYNTEWQAKLKEWGIDS